MSVDEDFELEQVLQRARRGLAPSAGDRARIAGRLAAVVSARPAAAPLRALHRAALVGAVALGGGIGYWQGYRAGGAVERVLPVIPVVEPLAASVAVVPAPTPPSVVAEAVSAPEAARAPRAARNPAASSEPRAPAPAGESGGLDTEVRELRRIEKAIREGNPRLALVLLEELARSIPQGQLLEERAAARVMASCQLGADSASVEARAFVARHASSAYVARVNEICGLDKQRISAPPGTDVPR